MKSLLTMVWIVVLGLAVWACSGAPSPDKPVWTAQPAVAEAGNSLVEAGIEPRKGDFPFFAHFLLTLTNKRGTDIYVDWNATQYLFNGRPQGVLVFEGIDPEAVGAGAVPLEAVPPGATFTRIVMPLRLIAWSPIREKTPGSRSITPGMFPAGMNGIRLAVRHAGGQLTIPLSVQISRQDAP